MDPKSKANTTPLTRKKRKKEKKPRSQIVKFILTVFKIIIIFLIAFSCAVIGIVGGAVFGYIKTAPLITPEQLQLNNMNSYVYAYNDTEHPIAELKGLENRILVDHSQIPDNLRHAFIAIEDKNFSKHSGVDIKRTLGAVLSYITHLGNAEYGGSTITQQLVKNITGNDKFSVPRKIQESWQAIQLEKSVTKDVILDNYMNRVLTGNGVYGVQSAAKKYFGKDVSKLSLAECASIAGIPNLPGYYAPVSEKGINHNKERQKIVLKEMLKQGYIDQQQYDQAVSEVLNFVDQDSAQSKASSAQSYFVDQVINDVISDLTKKYNWSRDAASLEVYSHGLKIYTTEDSNIQSAMDDVFTNDKYFQSVTINGEHPQASMTIIDPETGQVRALRGGYGQKKASFILNRATQIHRQVGSSFKPIADYAPAIDLGNITAGTVVDDVPVYMDNQHKDKKYPEDYPNDNGIRGYQGLTTIRSAIMKSINVVAAKVWMNYLGPDQSLQYLKKVGIIRDKKSEGNLSMALGGLTNGVNTYLMAAAYSPFVNKGVYNEPTTYLKVLDKDGNVLLEKKTAHDIAYKESTAFIMSNMLQDVCNLGTAYVSYDKAIQGQLQGGKMPTAGKTGTTNDDKDRMFIGFTHYYVGAVWYGYDNNYSVVTKDGINPALKIWHAVMEKAHTNLKPAAITEQPSDIIKKVICIDSGKVPNENCAKDPRGNRTRFEYFIKGTEPKDDDKCDIHVLAKVCKSSKDKYGRFLVAGPNCPLTTILEKVFIQRKEPYLPKNPEDPFPADWMFELPAGEYCTVHGAPKGTVTADIKATVGNTNTTAIEKTNTKDTN
jgi:penicillin-binding protein 1A